MTDQIKHKRPVPSYHIPIIKSEESTLCLHCGGNFSYEMIWRENPGIQLAAAPKKKVGNHLVIICENKVCKGVSLWKGEELLYPLLSLMPTPVEYMPAMAKELYDEALAVEPHSKRAALALIRLALESLLEELGEKTGNLNRRIENLYKKGRITKSIKDNFNIIRTTCNKTGGHLGIEMSNKDAEVLVRAVLQIINDIVKSTFGLSSTKNEIRDILAKGAKK